MALLPEGSGGDDRRLIGRGGGATPTTNTSYFKSSNPNLFDAPLPTSDRKASFGRVGSHSDIVKGTSHSSMISTEMLGH